jgi:hypothetical protein
MKSLPRYPETHVQTVRSVSTRECPELEPQEISALLMKNDDVSIQDEDMEIHLLRAQFLLARIDLEELFAEGQLGCT